VQAPRGEVVGGRGASGDGLLQGWTAHGFSRDHVPLLDKAIKLTWTLREQDCAFWHLMLLEKRGAIEHLHNPSMERKAKRTSFGPHCAGAARLKWPPRTRGRPTRFYRPTSTLIRLHELGVHQEAAEEIYPHSLP
jgi:hypothetical protein